jgi:hypothetical protein
MAYRGGVRAALAQMASFAQRWPTASFDSAPRKPPGPVLFVLTGFLLVQATCQTTSIVMI